MQSGIAASTELQEAFNAFTSNPSLFALPVTINNEMLSSAASAVPFTSDSFSSSLPSLKDYLQPNTPIYLILRPSPIHNRPFTVVTYVPSTAPVRQKMLFASTRSTLTRDLGLEKFGDSVFATDDFEVLDPEMWEERSKGVGDQMARSDDILSAEERELQGVKRAEEAERHGTGGRDLMGEGGSGGRLAMKITDDAKQALATLTSEGALVQLGIELQSETLELLLAREGVQPAEALGAIPSERPTYSFFHYPGTEEVLFVYTCPDSSKVKERMVYASARASVLQAVKGAGVNVTKRLEQGDTDDITEARLAEEAGVKSVSEEGSVRQGFAKPKRPGRR